MKRAGNPPLLRTSEPLGTLLAYCTLSRGEFTVLAPHARYGCPAAALEILNRPAPTGATLARSAHRCTSAETEEAMVDWESASSQAFRLSSRGRERNLYVTDFTD
ncbi:hypothetical protein GQ53DRAFT_262736 [Thozetella sp. PMI_491]|nr:hypothetical protein GQ53DRAFT_262736 [Thozetella sp. PMI_491]